MRFGSWRSDPFNVSSGLPQGSPLSCVLFNIYTADIIGWTKDEGTDPFSYVDDIIISCESESPVEALDKLQYACARLEQWTNNNHMRIQPDKVCWMMVSLRHFERDDLALKYAGEKVRQELEIMYLGVVIDSRLSMIGHISNNIRKARKLLELAIDIVGSREWRDRNPIINQAEVEQYIESVNVNIIIATDGSVREDVTAWAGLVWKNNRCIYKWCAGKHGRTSSFRAEMEGVEDALFWMSNNTSAQDTTLLLTDSKSLVAQLQSGMVKNTWLKLLRKIKSSIRITYIPGHAGITYNEAADHLAGMAEPFGHITFYQQDITNRLKENLNNDNAPKKTCWSFQRMKERAIKFGDGGRKTTRLSNTKTETQEIMGLITKNTLTNILKKGWPERYIS
ncbi:putative RNA-directed DNA polymerase from transposon BS [Exaiptasia diaphana]|nr:putative RNA-directed DNA polymerase from transposon BS [Exaiptasia diaphana]